MLERGKVERRICQAWRAVAIAKINTIYTFFILLVKRLMRQQENGNSPLLGSDIQLRTSASLCFQEGA